MVIGDHFVGKLSAVASPTKATQPYIPPGSVNEYVLKWIMEMETIRTAAGQCP